MTITSPTDVMLEQTLPIEVTHTHKVLMQLRQNCLNSSVWSTTDIKQLTVLKMGARVVDCCEMFPRGQFYLRGDLGVISQPWRETHKNFTFWGPKHQK